MRTKTYLFGQIFRHIRWCEHIRNIPWLRRLRCIRIVLARWRSDLRLRCLRIAASMLLIVLAGILRFPLPSRMRFFVGLVEDDLGDALEFAAHVEHALDTAVFVIPTETRQEGHDVRHELEIRTSS